MKDIIIKSMLTLLLIIEFYPIESNSQTITGSNNNKIDNVSNEFIYQDFELLNSETMNEEGVANIKFNIFKTGDVNLKVYSEDGKLVETLIDGNMEPGKYGVYFKCSEGFMTGEYYYEFEKDGIKQTRRMFLSKY